MRPQEEPFSIETRVSETASIFPSNDFRRSSPLPSTLVDAPKHHHHEARITASRPILLLTAATTAA